MFTARSLALYSISLHEVESPETCVDPKRYRIRLEMLRSEALARGEDWTVYDGPAPFDWDIVDHHDTPEEALAKLAASARAERDALIIASDCFMLADFPLPLDMTRTAWTTAAKAYRQALRDIPASPGFPSSITWPVSPLAEAPNA